MVRVGWGCIARIAEDCKIVQAMTLRHAPPAGVHINGYVRLPDGGLELWVARRSRTKPTWWVALEVPCQP